MNVDIQFCINKAVQYVLQILQHCDPIVQQMMVTTMTSSLQSDTLNCKSVSDQMWKMQQQNAVRGTKFKLKHSYFYAIEV